MAVALVESINVSHQGNLTSGTRHPGRHHPPPSTPQPALYEDNTGDSGEEDDPPLKKTARAKRAERNLGMKTARHHHHLLPSTSGSSVIPTGGTLGEGSLNEKSISDDGGPPTTKKSSHLSNAKNPSASKKRPRSSSPISHSSSPISPPKLGSKENPVDVDDFASVLEPMVSREYVRFLFFHWHSAYAEYTWQMKKEPISLLAETSQMTPLIRGDRLYTIYDVEGKPESVTPSFHVSH